MEEITKLFTIREIAHYLRCSKTHVGNLMLERVPGTPPLVHLTIGRKKVVRRDRYACRTSTSIHAVNNAP